MKPFLFVVLIVAAGCSQGYKEDRPQQQNEQPAVSAPQESTPVPEASRATANSVAGIQWSVPAGWTAQGERPMRAATYTIPAAEGDSEPGECAVFFFGTGQGGDVRSNIDRWISQFEPGSKSNESSRTINGFNVTTVEVEGTYLAPAGPMMQSQGKKENYRLLGAIVEAPEGAVFFKTTGPSKTIEQAEDEFNAMIESIES